MGTPFDRLFHGRASQAKNPSHEGALHHADHSLSEALKDLFRDTIRLETEGKPAEALCGGTRFGGQPDVPGDFDWPVSDCDARPLTFLAQFNLAELAPMDAEGLLPHAGLLSFFYDTDEQPWGYDASEQSAARVYWFEDLSALAPMAAPDDAETLSGMKLRLWAEKSLPEWEDFSALHLEMDDCDAFEEARAQLGADEEPEYASKLLGWPDAIQNSIFEDIAPKADAREWRLLFQMDSTSDQDFDLMFGDCGRLYFCIRREDLAARRFDRVRYLLQCY